MNLQTKISLLPKEPRIDYQSEVVMLGSCFAENIGEKFEYYKFKNLINPFGILFHPKAIETFLWMAVQDEKYTEADLFFNNGHWHCFDAHSSLSGPNKDKLISDLNSALLHSKKKISTATHICITLGTAWVYRLKTLDLVVANCHKVPQKEFAKELLSIEEISQCIHNCIHLIRNLNPTTQIVFTVSPVRHAKDGFVANTRSKSHLIAAIHNAVEQDKNLCYFPSYEIVMDELRDYRFYNVDMIHPSELAIQYIWERFSEVWFSENTINTMKKVEEIQKGLAHRPFHPESKQHLSFLQNLEQKKQKLQQEYSFIKF
ncbi:GSCFA domain-containing protein [Aquimarina sp. AU474]|uniref:GSCFA domain-containing protein n=1 Tax=Aquimarina sp. AU474 TaxID=2108529 RepID=UPI000D6967DF|nr:GSCFA domain-containing protein [Aquimarina sp. AU474]